MNTITITAALALLAVTTATVQAKDKHKNKDKHHRHYSERGDRDRHYGDRDHHYGDHYGHGDRSRTIYVIEGNRPVQRVVYLDSEGRYYRQSDGVRTYVRQHYFESYPARYYTPSGERRISISLPF